MQEELTARSLFPEFKQAGENFSFAIFADPQVGPKDSEWRVYRNARRTQIIGIKEINEREPRPIFALFLGDLVNVPDRPSFDNFLDCVKDAKMPKIWTHGNHDTRPPFDLYKEYQMKDAGYTQTYFSWDIGKWHMIVLPCNLDRGNEDEISYEENMLAWLEADLEANKDKLTMVFEHLPILPGGLSQMEWYTFRLELRSKLLDMLTKHGNVKWYFNGHIHNGIKAAEKMAVEYKGINFFTCPTIIEGRNFGEEYVQYEHGLPTGGYYSIVEVKGDDVTIKGRLVNVPEDYEFPKKFKEFTEKDEPRWFKRVVDIEPKNTLENGGFENGIDGWSTAWRYIADEHPAFGTFIDHQFVRSGKQSLMIFNHAKGREFWARDDNNPAYQIVKAPEGGRPIFKASYYLEERPENAGGFIRISAISDNEFKFMMMFNWSENEWRADYVPRCVGYEMHGVQQNWGYLNELGRKRQAMFWGVMDDPGQWHDLVIDIANMYDRCYGQEGAIDQLGVTKYHVVISTWSNRKLGSESVAYFYDISLTASEEKINSTYSNRPLPVHEHVFITKFGQDLKDDVESNWSQVRNE